GVTARSGTTTMATSTPSRKPTARTKRGLDRRRVAVARVRSISTMGCSLKLARAGDGACCGTEIGGDHRGVVAYDGRRPFGDDLALCQHVEAVDERRHHRDVVVDDDEGRAQVIAYLADHGNEGLDLALRDPGHGLVEQQDIGTQADDAP